MAKYKWEKYADKYNFTSVKKASFILTAENTREILSGYPLNENTKILDIGCGSGEIDILLAQKLNIRIIGIDISQKAIERAKENIMKAGLENEIKVEYGDVYNLNYPNEYFDIILSFGYVSVATYPEAIKEVNRVLKSGGFLICDFINPWSIYKIFKTIRNLFNNKEMPYYLFLSDIKQRFSNNHLSFYRQILFNTFPPVNIRFQLLLFFEKTIGRIFNKILGRVRLVAFPKNE